MRHHKVQDKYFQPRGMESGRTLRHALLAAVVPTGSGAGWAGRRYLVIAWAAHHLGRFLCPLLVRQEDRLHRLYQRLQRMRGK